GPGGGGGGASSQPAGPWGYGFQVQLWHFNADGKRQAAGLVRQAGFTWLKHQVEWQTVEATPGQFDWGELDAIVDTANQAGLKVLLSVAHAPPFYRGA